jgi:hypothetical protein
MLTHTSTEWAPWHVIPGDRKWFERLSVGLVLAHTLLAINPQFPKVSDEQRQALLEIKETLEAQAPKGAAADPFAASLDDGKANGSDGGGESAARAAIEASEPPPDE